MTTNVVEPGGAVNESCAQQLGCHPQRDAVDFVQCVDDLASRGIQDGGVKRLDVISSGNDEQLT